MALTEAKLRAAKPRDTPYKIYDSDGLFVVVAPSGSKLWRFRFVQCGKESVISLGAYPAVGLLAARKKRNLARDSVLEGGNPAVERRKKKEAIATARLRTFRVVAMEWFELRKHEWSPDYRRLILARLSAYIFPHIGDTPISEIRPKLMLETLRKVEARGILETTRRVKQYCSGIFRYGIISEYCEADPAAPLKGALKAPPRAKHHKALRRDEVGPFLVLLSEFQGDPETAIAIELAMLMVPRTSELRAARWKEFENWRQSETDGLWRVPAERMKMEEPHLVPISRQARRKLLELHKITGHTDYLFPGRRGQEVMSNNTMLFGIYRMGYYGRTTTHGFRRLFSTEANENGWNEDWIERQLAHDERDRVRAAYNAAQYLSQRRQMMQWWADQLDRLRQTYLLQASEHEPADAEREGA